LTYWPILSNIITTGKGHQPPVLLRLTQVIPELEKDLYKKIFKNFRRLTDRKV